MGRSGEQGDLRVSRDNSGAAAHPRAHDRVVELPALHGPPQGGRQVFLIQERRLAKSSGVDELDSLGAEPKLLLDPNTWSKDGTIALAGMALTDDAKFLAYGVAEAGSDWNHWKVMEIASRKVLDDEIKW